MIIRLKILLSKIWKMNFLKIGSFYPEKLAYVYEYFKSIEDYKLPVSNF